MAYITKRTTANGTKPIGSNLYGTCSTAGNVAEKVVSMPDFDVLVSGVTIHVKFSNANTASAPKLKVGSTSAVSIRRNGALEGTWQNGSVISFTYDGTAWVQNDADVNGVSYTLTKDGTTIKLTGSDGTETAVTDSDTTYGLQFTGGKLSLVEGGSALQVAIPDNNTTYTISKSGNTVTLTGSDGSTSSVTVSGSGTTYGLSISGHTVSLVEGGTTASVTVPDNNTWNANSKDVAGYVPAPTASGAHGYYGTDTNGNPMWITPKVQTDEVYTDIATSDINTYNQGASLFLDKGIYYIEGVWSFQNFTTTGATAVELQIRNMTSGNVLTRDRRQSPNNYAQFVKVCHIYTITQDNTAIALRASTSRAYTVQNTTLWGAGFNKIYAFKLV